MHESNLTVPVDDYLSRHAAQLKNLDLLSVQFEDLVLWVGQAHKRYPVLAPIGLEDCRFFRSGHNDFTASGPKFIIIIAQLRNVSAAEGSRKPPIEN